MSRRVYGKAFPITEKQAKSYDRVSRTRKALRPNPIGVTSMALVNGKGAYKRAKSLASVVGKLSKEERSARARKVMKGNTAMRTIRRRKPVIGWEEELLRLRKNPKKKKPAKKSTARKSTARKSTARKSPARKSPARKSTARKSTARKSTARKSPARKSPARKSPARRSTPEKLTAAEKRLLATASRLTGKSVTSKVRKKPKKKTRKESFLEKYPQFDMVPAKRKQRIRYGKYKRHAMYDPMTNRKRMSYMYFDREAGKFRRIPKSALSKYGKITDSQISSARSRAAEKVRRRGTAFTPNKKAPSARSKRSSKRYAAYKAAIDKGYSKTKAINYALRVQPLARGDVFQGMCGLGGGKAATSGRTKARKASGVGKRISMRKRKGNKRRASSKRRRMVASKRRAVSKKRRMTRNKRRVVSKKRRMTRNKRRSPVTRRRRGVMKRRMRRNGRRRSMFRKNGFTSSLLGFLKTGALVTTGFFTHKALTHLVADKLVNAYILKADSASEAVQKLRPYSKPIAGLAVLIPGLLLTNYVADALGKGNKANANYLKSSIGAGMVASWIQNTVVTVLTQMEQPSIVPYLSGYTDSTAASLRGYAPVSQSGARSIMPMYAPVSGVGGVYQAAAGFSQAAAGYHQAAAGTGEYFQANSIGEYFAPNSMKGIGEYEAAGELSMVRTSGEISDGIRPDSNLDQVLDLTEAAAGVGAYETASGRVGTSSTWIPGQSNPQMWAGKEQVSASMQSSDIPAGVLQGQGGNGILSA